MRKEYDFSQGKIGKHTGKRIRIVGDNCSPMSAKGVIRIQRIIQQDLKSRKKLIDFAKSGKMKDE